MATQLKGLGGTLTPIELSMQLRELTQTNGAEQRALLEKVDQASQKVMDILKTKIEALKKENTSLREQLRVCESQQQPLLDEEKLCEMRYQGMVATLEAQLKMSQDRVAETRRLLKDQLECAVYHLKQIESCLFLSKDIAQGVVTKKWLDAHKDWKS